MESSSSSSAPESAASSAERRGSPLKPFKGWDAPSNPKAARRGLRLIFLGIAIAASAWIVPLTTSKTGNRAEAVLTQGQQYAVMGGFLVCSLALLVLGTLQLIASGD